MKNLKITLLLLCTGLLISCNNFVIFKGDYSYAYLADRKKINFTSGHWIFVQNYQPSNKETYEVFEKYLKNRIQYSHQIKNEAGKRILPKSITSIPNVLELQQIRELTHADFLVTTKVIPFKRDGSFIFNGDKIPTENLCKGETYIIYIYNLQSAQLEYQLNCLYTESKETQYKIALLVSDAESKLLKKIKKYAIVK